MSYLLKRVLPKLLGPPALILAIRQSLLAHGSSQYLPSIAESTSGIALLSLASSILFIAGRVWWHQLRTHVEARRLGATIVPKVKGKLPGNIDVLWAMARYWPDDYVGHPVTEMCKKYGNTFNIYILWEDWVSYSLYIKPGQGLIVHQIWTSNPAHMKIILATDFPNYIKGLYSLNIYRTWFNTLSLQARNFRNLLIVCWVPVFLILMVTCGM